MAKFKGEKKAKTDTIKKRSIYVYLPSEGMVSKWKKKSDKENLSISKFVIEHVENSLRQEEDEDGYTSRIKLVEENRRLNEENKEIHRKIKILDKVVDRLEEELRSHRLKPFLSNDFTGVRNYEKDLIDLFKQKKEIRKEDLIGFLDIKTSDTNSVKGISKQIENLEKYGLLKDLGGKWIWKG